MIKKVILIAIIIIAIVSIILLNPFTTLQVQTDIEPNQDHYTYLKPLKIILQFWVSSDDYTYAENIPEFRVRTIIFDASGEERYEGTDTIQETIYLDDEMPYLYKKTFPVTLDEVGKWRMYCALYAKEPRYKLLKSENNYFDVDYALTVYTTPIDCFVNVTGNGVNLKDNSYNGVTYPFYLDPGIYTATIEKSGYNPYTQTVAITSDNVDLSVVLDEINGGNGNGSGDNGSDTTPGFEPIALLGAIIISYFIVKKSKRRRL